MGRRTLNRKELRAEAEAAEARGVGTSRGDRKPPSEPRVPKAEVKDRMKVVWVVRDVFNHVVKTFDYPQKADAEALAAQLKAQGKGNHTVRSEKQPM